MSTTVALTPSQLKDLLVYLEQEVTRCLANAFGTMLGAPPEISKAPDYPVQTVELWFHQKFKPDDLGSVDFGLDKAGALAIGQKLLTAAGLEGETDETVLETLGEVLSQIGGGLASSFSGRLKREVVAKAIGPGTIPADAAHRFTCKVSTLDDAILYFTVIAQSSLLAGLFPDLPQETSKGMITQGSPTTTSLNTRNLELLLDLELPVSVSFGRAQLQLKDVIRLTTGSIVELNRSVSEPVDIIVNNCIIARGEVVVVEGNFGVRIKQIISKEERLRSLG
jgi:flagellar motor switch protein FliN/FliY